MNGYELEIEGLEEQLRKLEAFDPIVQKHFKQAMQQSLLTIGSKVVPMVPVGVSARLKNSMGSEITELGNGNLVGKYGSSLKDEIYPQVMEYGRAPGTMPPPDALLRWVHLKIRPGLEMEQSVAFRIARKIKQRGIKGNFFMRDGLEKSKKQIKLYFDLALNRIARELTNGR